MGKDETVSILGFSFDDSNKTRSMEMQLTSNIVQGDLCWTGVLRVLTGRLGHSCERMQGTLGLENTNHGYYVYIVYTLW